MKKLTFILLFSSSMLCANDNRGLFEKFKDWGNEKPNTNFYIFGSVGSFGNTDSEAIKFVDSNYEKVEENKGGGKFGLGYNINQYFAIEVQGINFGNSKYNGNYRYIDKSHYGSDYRWDVYEYEENLSVETRGVGINFVGLTPTYNNFSLFGKVGAHRMTSKYKYELLKETYQIYGQTQILNSTREKSKVTEDKTITTNIATFAVGLMYNIQQRWFLTLEHERFTGISKGNFLNLDTEYDSNLTSFGIGLRF